MLSAHEKFRRAVPDSHDNFVANIQRLERIVAQTRKTEVTDLDDTRGCDENVRGFQITVHDMRVVEIHDAIEELEEKGFDNRNRDGITQH